MITRYTRPEMAKVWSQENKFQKWMDVELAAKAHVELGNIPENAYQTIVEKPILMLNELMKLNQKFTMMLLFFDLRC